MDDTKYLFKNFVALKFYSYNHPNYNIIRRTKLILFGDIMNNYKKFNLLTYTKKISMITDVEKSCYRATLDKASSSEYDIPILWNNIRFENLYHSVCYNVAMNLDSTSIIGSTYLSDSILNKKIPINNIGKLSSRLMCPQIYTLLDKKIDKIVNVENNVKTTELYKCFKCKRNQCTVETVINRSLDEGSGFIIRCMFCGNHWIG